MKSKSVFTRNLPRYFNGRERIGMSLTGGFDIPNGDGLAEVSTRIAAVLTRSGSAFRDNRDVIIARRVARACGQPHHVIVRGDGAAGNFPRLADARCT